MASTRDAILNAVAAATRLHQEHDARSHVDRGEGRINVFRMIIDRDIPFIFRPLRGLLGAFVNEPGPGVMITTQRPLSVQRFTAAHELGHAVLGHQPSLDDDGMLRRTPFSGRPQYELHEIEADAFASELLMPRWLLAHHVKRQGWAPQDLHRPDVIYQLSLRIGVSYSATCYALQRHNVLDYAACQKLQNIQPQDIKKTLSEGVEPASWHGDVWVLTERDDGLLLEGSRSDLVVVKLLEHSGSGYIWRLNDLLATGLHVLKDTRTRDGEEEYIGSPVLRNVIAQPSEMAKGVARLTEVRPWQPDVGPAQILNLRVDLSGPIAQGLLVTEREQLLGAA